MNRKSFNKIIDSLIKLRSLVPGCDKERNHLLEVAFNNLEAPTKKRKTLEVNGILLEYPTSEEVKIGMTLGKLDMVKAYKNRTNCSLMDAKQLVEAFFEFKKLKFK